LSNTTSSSVVAGIAINQHGCVIFSDKRFLQSQQISNGFQFLIGRDFSIKTYFISIWVIQLQASRWGNESAKENMTSLTDRNMNDFRKKSITLLWL